jgi:hypothetical protein
VSITPAGAGPPHDRPRARCRNTGRLGGRDEVYGADPQLRADLERQHVGYVLAVAKGHTAGAGAGACHADALAARVPRSAVGRLSGQLRPLYAPFQAISGRLICDASRASRACRGTECLAGCDNKIGIRCLLLMRLSSLGRQRGLAPVPIGVLAALEPDAAKHPADCEASGDQRVPWEGMTDRIRAGDRRDSMSGLIVGRVAGWGGVRRRAGDGPLRGFHRDGPLRGFHR